MKISDVNSIFASDIVPCSIPPPKRKFHYGGVHTLNSFLSVLVYLCGMIFKSDSATAPQVPEPTVLDVTESITQKLKKDCEQRRLREKQRADACARDAVIDIMQNLADAECTPQGKCKSNIKLVTGSRGVWTSGDGVQQLLRAEGVQVFNTVIEDKRVKFEFSL